MDFITRGLRNDVQNLDPGSEMPLWCDGKSDNKNRSSDESQEAAAPLSKRDKRETNND